MKIIGQLASLLILACLIGACSSDESRTDEAELLVLLGWFLVEVDHAETHDAFWADDLVYTSSNGTRFGKAEIMAGFDTSEGTTDEVVDYVGSEIDIRVFDQTAVIAFQLRGTPTDGSAVQYYFNTGFFVKRDDVWQAVAWQATKILDAVD